jgi:hypothetical protein
MHQPTPSLFNQYADTLVKNGYRPLPGYQDTKRPSIKNWNQYNDRQPWNHAELMEVMAGPRPAGRQDGLVLPSRRSWSPSTSTSRTKTMMDHFVDSARRQAFRTRRR